MLVPVACQMLFTDVPLARAEVTLSSDLSASISHRIDDLSWNIAGSTVDVLSELKWQDVSIAELRAAGSIHLRNQVVVRGRLGYGVVGSGLCQDSDYNGSNRTQEYSRSVSQVGGDVFDASIGLGRVLPLPKIRSVRSSHVTPSVGLSMHQQNLTMADGIQVIPASGPFPGLDSSYDAEWIGPWFGLEALIEAERGWLISANVEYHLVDYSAVANWNLRTDMAHPVSFSHIAKGDGVLASVGLLVPVRKYWKLEFSLEYGTWRTDVGTDQVYLSDGTAGVTRLNGVQWNSTAYRLGAVRDF